MNDSVKRKFKIGDYVRRIPETVTFPEVHKPFFVMFVMERSSAVGGFMYSEDDHNWVAQDYLEKVE